MEVVSRVTGISYLDEPVLALEQGAGPREGLAERKLASILAVDSDDEELCTSFLEGRPPDVDALSSLCAEPLSSTPARLSLIHI